MFCLNVRFSKSIYKIISNMQKWICQRKSREKNQSQTPIKHQKKNQQKCRGKNSIYKIGKTMSKNPLKLRNILQYYPSNFPRITAFKKSQWKSLKTISYINTKLGSDRINPYIGANHTTRCHQKLQHKQHKHNPNKSPNLGYIGSINKKLGYNKK